jgi:hypothetical protein
MIALESISPKALLPDDFFDIVENTLCLSSSRTAHFCGLLPNRLEYWINNDLTEIPEFINFLGFQDPDCSNLHLREIKFIFAMNSFVQNKIKPHNARVEVIAHAQTLADWNQNFQSDWEKHFRTNMFFRLKEAVEIINLISKDSITMYNLKSWIEAGLLFTLCVRAEKVPEGMIDPYQLYGAYLLACVASENQNQPAKNYCIATKAKLVNDYLREQFELDLIKNRFDLPSAALTSSKTLTKNDLRTELLNFISNSFPEMMTLRQIMQKSGLPEEVSEIIETLLSEAIVVESKIGNTYAYRLNPAIKHG